ncbi:MAG: AAA family ATPase, partial [Mycobacteriaceae bacterium]
LGAVVLGTDRERKQLMGLAPTMQAAAPYGSGIYTPDATRRTYSSLAARTKTLLGMGESVVLDASFADPDFREMFRRVGLTMAAHVVELRCSAPAATIEARLRDRGTRPDPYSDADLDIGRRITSQWQEWPQAATIDTAHGADVALSSALTRVVEAADDPFR